MMLMLNIYNWATFNFLPKRHIVVLFICLSFFPRSRKSTFLLCGMRSVLNWFLLALKVLHNKKRNVASTLSIETNIFS